MTCVWQNAISTARIATPQSIVAVGIRRWSLEQEAYLHRALHRARLSLWVQDAQMLC